MSKRYLTIYNLQREKDWVLKNAYDIIETREINTVWSLEFSIPMNDQDMEHCQPYWYVRYGDDGQLYRITEQSKTNAAESTVTYHCEHVISTLCDDVMFQGPYIKGNTGTYTNQVINFILDKQTVKNWKLGTCQPRRQFEYSWENENLLAALWSVPSCFATPYIWTFDTTSYPWTINLLNLDGSAEPNFYLMAKKNILRRTDTSSSLDVCTRLYGLGEGEGVNQLTIKSVNNGLPYVQSSPEKIAEYGIVSRIFVDRRYQYPETLKARMETLLKELETPSLEREFEIVDLYDMSPDDMYKAEVGNIVLLKEDGTQTYITKTVKNWSVPGDMKITIATKPRDIASSIADLADRQRIEQVYSQGASQVYSFNFSGNATDEYPLNGYVYFPEDLKYLNEVKLKVKLDPFRSYSASTAAAAVTVQSCENKTVTVKSCENKTVTLKTNDAALTGKQTTESGGGTTSSSGGTSVTVSGGSTSGGSTDDKTVSMKVSVNGTVSAPMETETSLPSTEVTSGTDWLTGDNYVTAGYTEDAYLDVGNGNAKIEITGGGGSTQTVDQDYSMTGGPLPWGVADDSHYHQLSHHHTVNLAHSHGINQSGHDHRLYDIEGNEAAYHKHAIKKSKLSHSHNITHYHTVNVSGSASGGTHSHTFSIPDHTHNISAHSHNLPDLSHSHKIELNAHTHDIKLNSHTHDIKLEGHSHDIVPGIFESGSPSKADLLIDGKKKATINRSETELDITELLLSNGKVPRGQWIQIGIKPTNPAPNNMAYISVFGNVFAFIQSYTGGNY